MVIKEVFYTLHIYKSFPHLLEH